MLLFFWLVFVGLVTFWATKWGRSGCLFLLLSVLLSPLIAGLILLICGNKNKVPPAPQTINVVVNTNTQPVSTEVQVEPVQTPENKVK